MGARWILRSVAVVGAVMVWLGLVAGAASAAVTPGWECIPATAGQAVVSGGTGATPSCLAGKTAVLAPTYVSSGVGGKPTVQFAAVNVQIVNGSGSTASVNGMGNLVLGYDENPGGRAQTGSHDLILGQKQSFTSFGGLVGGIGNAASGAYASVLGNSNTASGPEAAVTGGQSSTARGTAASVSGGLKNVATSPFASVAGGCSNIAGAGTVSLNSTCTNTSTNPNSFASVTGGVGNQAANTGSSVTGGEVNGAHDAFSSIAGGCGGITGTRSQPFPSCPFSGFETILGGLDNDASGQAATVSGGEQNQATGFRAAVGAGAANKATGFDSSVSGGSANQASFDFTSVSGGQVNIASGRGASVSGGCQNVAGSASAPTGSCPGAAPDQAVTGGQLNIASGGFASITGGTLNRAGDPFSVVVSGCQNVTGSAAALTGSCPSPPAAEAVTGGYLNAATGHLSVVTGGWANAASTSKSAILGGQNRTVSSACQTVPATNTC